jgi:hypothetical protein
MAHEIMKKSEKDIHDAREAVKEAEKAAELERRIGIVQLVLTLSFVFVASNLLIFLLQLNYLLHQNRSTPWQTQKRKK